MKSNSKQKKKKKTAIRITPDWKWIAMTFGLTVGISSAMSFMSNEVLSASGMAVSFVVLLAIIMIGILFDIIGMSVTAAEEKPFHSMAAKKVPEAAVAIRLIRRADRVSSICNDVVGDICGIISGSASAVIAASVVLHMEPAVSSVLKLLMSALVAALTVGGKAFGKSIAMNNATLIIHTAARIIYFFRHFPQVVVHLFKHK